MKNQKIKMINNQLYDDSDIYLEYEITNERVFNTYTPINNMKEFMDRVVAEVARQEKNCVEIIHHRNECLNPANDKLVSNDIITFAA